MSQPVVTRAFEIAGMHCTSCAMSIDWELEDVDGVRAAKTSYARARTEVTYDPTTVAEPELLAAIERAGFAARVIDEGCRRPSRRAQ